MDQTDQIVVTMAAEHARRHKNLDIDPETEIALQDIHNFSVALLKTFRAANTSESALLGMIFLESYNAALVDIPRRELVRLATTLECLLDEHTCPALVRCTPVRNHCGCPNNLTNQFSLLAQVGGEPF